MHRLLLFSFFFLIWNPFLLKAQSNNKATSKSDVEYELMYDEPYDLQKMWLQFIPLYSDYFSTNLNLGYGIQGNYLLKEKFTFRLHYRHSFGKGTDFARGAGEKNRTNSNQLRGAQYLEAGFTYHIRDQAQAGTSRMVIYSRRYTYEKWAATVPEHILIPAKVREILGARLGGYYWNSSINLSDVLVKQKVSLVLPDPQDPKADPDTLDPRTQKLYTNIQSAGIYLGTSWTSIRNVAIKPKKYDSHVNDVILTLYADLLFAPLLSLENIRFRDPLTRTESIFDSSPVKLSKLGFRLGIEGLYNREFGWSWGGELGYRPSIQGRSFYAMAKVGFAIATRFDQKRGATQIVKPSE
jgi:hypothetical protein